MPRWVTSDGLTILALLAMVGTGLSFWLASVSAAGLVLVVLCLAINWFGDSLDGTLARVRRQERPRYGFYVDHVVDAIGTLCLFTGLGLSGYMSPVVATALLVGYLLMFVEVSLAAQTLGTFRLSYFKVGPTELRILLAVGAIAAYFQPTALLFGHEWLMFDVGGTIGAAGLFLTFVTSAVGNTRRLYRLEPITGAPSE
jgi:phosphatidylglycerophosphate synthase